MMKNSFKGVRFVCNYIRALVPQRRLARFDCSSLFTQFTFSLVCHVPGLIYLINAVDQRLAGASIG